MGDKTRSKKKSRTKRKIPSKCVSESRKRKAETEETIQQVHSPSVVSSSAKKLCKSDTVVLPENPSLGNGIVNLDLLVNFLSTFRCPKIKYGRCCGGVLTVEVRNLGGLAQCLVTTCSSCKDTQQQALSSRTATEGSKSHEINRRYIAAVTSIGGHHAECNKLAAYLGLPKPCSPTAYKDHLNAITTSAQKTAQSSMSQAAAEAELQMNSKDVRVSVDGTWQRRGFSSKNGVVTVLSVLGKHQGSKVIDTETLTTYCHGCTQLTHDSTKLSTVAKHSANCKVNHKGSAGAMEAAGALKIFQRSEAQHGLRYTEYLGDGDSKAYKTVCDSEVYGSTEIAKLECTGHIQKRMGKHLMAIVSDNKSKTFVVNAKGELLQKNVANKARGEKRYMGIGGAGRLTSHAIKKIQGHYGAAIRENDTVDDMRKAIWVIYKHRSGDHSTCPSWCAIHDNDEVKANKSKLPSFVCDAMRPVFEKLSSDELLGKCVHGGTQNANEAYHHTLWERCPKQKFAGVSRIQLAVAISTIAFNDGESGIVSAFEDMGIICGSDHRRYAIEMDKKRVAKANKAVSDKIRAKRQSSQANKSVNKPDKADYASGAF